MVRTPDWVKDAVFYQIFPDRFARGTRNRDQVLNLEPWDAPPTPLGFKGGDLWGVLDHLDHLQDLGVTAIYLNPIFASAANHRYHTYDYYAVDPLLGGNAALRALLDTAHRRGIRVVLDGVFNHCGRGFWQFHHTLENGATSPYVDWFHFDPDRLMGKRPWGAYAPTESTASPAETAARGTGSLEAFGYKAWWDLPALPKLRTETPAVREFIFQVAEHWVRFGIDGWRLDVPAEIDDEAFWRTFRRRVKAINPQAYIVGEIWTESKRWLQGDRFDAVMNYPIAIAALGFLTGPHLDLDETHRAGGYRHTVRSLDAAGFAQSVEAALSWYHPEVTQAQLNLLDSHDTPRFLTSARGDLESLKLGLLFLFTLPGAPCIYYGDEIGMEGRQDPDCRRSFPWDRSRWNHDLLAYTKTCVRLRKRHRALRRGSFRPLLAADDVYVYGRTLGSQRLVIALNAGDGVRSVPVPRTALGKSAHLVLGGMTPRVEGDRMILTLAPRSGVVLR